MSLLEDVFSLSYDQFKLSCFYDIMPTYFYPQVTPIDQMHI